MKMAGCLLLGLALLAAGCSRGGSMRAVLEGKVVPLTVKASELGQEYTAVSISSEGFDMMGYVFNPMMWWGMSGTGREDEELTKRLFALWMNGETLNIDGQAYYIAYGFDVMSLGEAMDGPRLPENLSLRLLRAEYVRAITPMGDLRPTMGEDAVREGHRDNSLRNLRYIGSAMHLYLTDYDEVFPYATNTATVFGVLWPYVLDESVVVPPNENALYEFNMNLAGVMMNSVKKPSETPLFYETEPNEDGSRNVAFVDSHAKAISAENWPAVQEALGWTFRKSPGVAPLPPEHGHAMLPQNVRERLLR